MNFTIALYLDNCFSSEKYFDGPIFCVVCKEVVQENLAWFSSDNFTQKKKLNIGHDKAFAVDAMVPDTHLTHSHNVGFS